MSYSHLQNGFRSHLTGREYHFVDRQSKREVFAQMLIDDKAVRDAAQQRAAEAGVKKPLSDRSIARGDFIPDSRSTVERIADQVASHGPGKVKHDPYATAIDTVRGTVRFDDSPEVRARNDAIIARLTAKSAEWAQLKAATPAVMPNEPAEKAHALREAAAEVANAYAGTPAEKNRNAKRAEALLRQAGVEDSRAEQERAYAAKLEDAAGAIADSTASLFLLAKDPEMSQATVNEVRQMNERLKSGDATKEQWWALVERIDGERAALKKSKLDANTEERKRIDAERASIRADAPPAAEPPAPEPPKSKMEEFLTGGNVAPPSEVKE